jgi:serine/threonine-protein kinase
MNELLSTDRIEVAPAEFLTTVGRVFAEFGEHTQDSGNVSYGLEVGDARYFVKTAGVPDDTRWLLEHCDRVALLRNAADLAGSCNHRAQPALQTVIESPHGPMLVYDRVEGELLRAAPAEGDTAGSASPRFRALSAPEVSDALGELYRLHQDLAAVGCVAGDFYDGALIYDFSRSELHVIDLDHYRRGAYLNKMGRMFGSSRFMTPEEFERSATIDERTTVFTLGRTAAVLLSDGSVERALFRGSDDQFEVIRRACQSRPDDRYGSVGAFVSSWEAAS